MNIVAFKTHIGEEIIAQVSSDVLETDGCITLHNPLMFIPGREGTFQFVKWSFLNGGAQLTIRGSVLASFFYEPIDEIVKQYQSYIGDTVIKVPEKKIITG